MPTELICGSATPSPLMRASMTCCDLTLNLAGDLRDLGTRLQLQQDPDAALQIEAELDLMLDREDEHQAKRHDRRQKSSRRPRFDSSPHR